METLKALNKDFYCSAGSELNNIDCQNLLSLDNSIDVPKVYDLGFLIVKNVISKEEIKKARDSYFNLFNKGEYKRYHNDWIHIRNHVDSHGCKNHPSKKFLESQEFLKISKSIILKKISAKLLRSNTTTLCPRMIVRSFSKLSERCTFAHRDKEYFKSKQPNNVITCWIPMGFVGSNNGQLIYLIDSHKKKEKIDKLVNSEKIISKDFKNLSNKLNLKWYRPIIDIGDIIFHSLDIIHASFDSNSEIPRLSIDLRFAASNEDLDPRWSSKWRGDDGL
tara:strand:+ start:1602 stop:2432 length:831 start_codon:yes stop_codon:yes gene_type:complete